MINALSVDVEECFHASEVQLNVSRPYGPGDSRVEAQTRAVLELLQRHRTHATFFVLGSVAAQNGGIVREIVESGHDVGCHSYAHQLIYNLTPRQFREDTMRAVRLIYDACGVQPRIYRAPSYSITERSLWALEILVECGFTHDSSIYPIHHDRYGIPGFPRHAHLVQTPAGPICEIPVATVRLPRGAVAPVGGGGYLRMLPYRYTAAGIRRVNFAEGKPACLYFHPWELDDQQPRHTRGLIARLRTYSGTATMYGKVERLLTDFHFDTIAAAYEHAHGKEVAKSADCG